MIHHESDEKAANNFKQEETRILCDERNIKTSEGLCAWEKSLLFVQHIRCVYSVLRN